MPQISLRNGASARHAFAGRLTIVISAATLLGGCGTGMPQRRSGSDVTLPPSMETRVLRALVSPCDATADSTGVRARNVVDCGLAKPRTATVPDPQRTGPTQTAP